MATTSIEWTATINPDGSVTKGKVWNPTTGCTKVSQGCKNCYAKRIAKRFWGDRKFSDVQCHEDRIWQPRGWKKPSKIFVNSMSDLFHEKVAFEFVLEVWVSMWGAPQHTFQILTKRPDRMKEFVNDYLAEHWGYRTARMRPLEEPLPNVWLGASVEDQTSADLRIPYLLQTQAAVRFVSYEPALGAVDFKHIHDRKNQVYYQALKGSRFDYGQEGCGVAAPMAARLNWIICGGESGPGARPMNQAWARSARDQCVKAGVPFFFKQWGEWLPVSQSGDGWGNIPPKTMVDYLGSVPVAKVGKRAAGRLLDGRTWDEFPAR